MLYRVLNSAHVGTSICLRVHTGASIYNPGSLFLNRKTTPTGRVVAHVCAESAAQRPWTDCRSSVIGPIAHAQYLEDRA